MTDKEKKRIENIEASIKVQERILIAIIATLLLMIAFKALEFHFITLPLWVS